MFRFDTFKYLQDTISYTFILAKKNVTGFMNVSYTYILSVSIFLLSHFRSNNTCQTVDVSISLTNFGKPPSHYTLISASIFYAAHFPSTVILNTPN